MVKLPHALVASLLVLSLGCPADEGSGAGGSDSSGAVDAGDDPTTTSPPPPASTTSGAMTGDDSSGGDPPATSSSTGEPDGSSSSDGGPWVPPVPMSETPCGNAVYECGDIVDNDGDGFIDLFDPECTGPCDDDESSFSTGLPGDNMDCKQDCFFDGNSGAGNDHCEWSLTCDPANPGANIGCEYTGGMNCDAMPPPQPETCLTECTPYVPPGCDCFGCCTVQTPEGDVDIFLNSGPDCALDNLAACLPCTSQIEICGNPCEPEMCEICFGELQPPPGCDMQECDNDLPCTFNEDCPTDFYCMTGCCVPPPPG
jgi:hypothetical protein